MNNLDTILYEIINEPPSCPLVLSSDKLDAWERHITKVIRDAEANTLRQHPVLRGVYLLQTTNNNLCPQKDNAYLFTNLPPINGTDTNTNTISPWSGDPTTEDYAGSATGPKASDGTRVIISDTDHLWGLDNIPGSTRYNIPGATDNPPFSDQPVNWVWKSLTRGMGGLVFVDPDVVPLPCNPGPCPIKDDTTSLYAHIRQAMGDARTFAGIIDLIHMTPENCSNTGYCLAQTLGNQRGNQFLAYAPTVPSNSTITLTLIGAIMGDSFNLTWFNPQTREFVAGGSVIAPPNNMPVPVTVPTSLNGTVWAKAVACLAKSATTFTCPTISGNNYLRPRR